MHCASTPICSRVFAAAVLLMIGAGCSTTMPSLPPLFSSRPVDTESYWDGDDMTGSPSVRIDLSDQRAYFFKGGKLAGVSMISSGREGLDTVTGHFHIIQKDPDHRSSVFGDYVDANGEIVQKDVDTNKDPKPAGAHYVGARMPHFMRIVGGTGMHEGFLPGYPASHGCIRMPGAMAEVFYRNLSVGTPVIIEP